MSVTIKDVAIVAGVSYGTVSRVLNNRSGVNPQTRENVLEAMKTLGYQPNAIARNLVMQKSNSIALVVPDIASPFFGNITMAINERAIDAGYNVMLYNSNYNLALEKRILDFIQQQRVDGLIIKPAHEDSAQFLEYDIPTVLISHLHKGIPYVDVDNKQGGFLAGKHTAACGYKTPAFLGGFVEATSTQERLKGYLKGLAEHGIALKQENTFYGKYSIAHGCDTMKQILQRGNVPDCIFCGNDQIALGVMQCADAAGLTIPQSLGIIGFDDVLIPSLPRIELTTIAQPIEEMGETAATLLFDVLEERVRDQVVPHNLPPRLVVRSSTNA